MQTQLPDGTPVTVRMLNETYSSPPDDVLANISHLAALARKRNLLNECITETTDALMASIERWVNPAPSDVDHIRATMVEHGVKGSKAVAKTTKISRGRHTWGSVPFAVYVLTLGGEAIYVGRSIDWRHRVASHRTSGKPFDSVQVYECSSHAEMCDLEAVLQQQHAPRCNRRIEQRP